MVEYKYNSPLFTFCEHSDYYRKNEVSKLSLINTRVL